MAGKLFVATIQVVVEANSWQEAADGLSAMLTEEQMIDGDGFLLDWGYMKAGAQLLYPTENVELDPDDYEEGEAWA